MKRTTGGCRGQGEKGGVADRYVKWQSSEATNLKKTAANDERAALSALSRLAPSISIYIYMHLSISLVYALYINTICI